MKPAGGPVSFLQSILSKLLPQELCARCGHPRPRSAERCKVCGLARGTAVQEAADTEVAQLTRTGEANPSDARRAA